MENFETEGNEVGYQAGDSTTDNKSKKYELVNRQKLQIVHGK
jgi:hypothetical protein